MRFSYFNPLDLIPYEILVKNQYIGYSLIIAKRQFRKLFTPIENYPHAYSNYLKMDYNENSKIKLTIEPCLCCV